MLLKRELEDRIDALKEAKQAAETIRYWRDRPRHAVVADANVFLHHQQLFDEVCWRELIGYRADPYAHVRLIVSILVVDELDQLKDRGQDDVRRRARKTLCSIYRPARLITSCCSASRQPQRNRGAILRHPNDQAPPVK